MSHTIFTKDDGLKRAIRDLGSGDTSIAVTNPDGTPITGGGGGGGSDSTPNTSYRSLVVSVADTATELRAAGTDLTGRQIIIGYNDGTETIFIGPSGVTASGATKGLPIGPGMPFSLLVGPNNKVYGICATGLSSSMIVQEAS